MEQAKAQATFSILLFSTGFEGVLRSVEEYWEGVLRVNSPLLLGISLPSPPTRLNCYFIY
jgi:hypothetical protein